MKKDLEKVTVLEVKEVAFNNVNLLGIKGVDGKIYTPVKKICDDLGIDTKSQIQRIKRDELLFEGGVIITLPSNGGPQDTFCLDVNCLPVFLVGIQSKKCKVEIQPYLKEFKLKIQQVLINAFIKKEAPQIKIPTYSEALRLLADNLDKTEKLEIENKKQSDEIKELLPQSLLLNVFTSTSELKTLRQIGYKLKPYGLGPNKIFDFLRKHKVITNTNNENYPTHAYTDLLKIETVVRKWTDKNTGEEKSKAFDILKAHTGFYKVLAGLLVNDEILTINQFQSIDFNNVPKDEQCFEILKKVG